MITLSDTLTGARQPLPDRPVRLYVCGITPYDTTHLGHASINVVYDTLRRYLAWRGQPVTYVQNVTDIDDDILRRRRSRMRDGGPLGPRSACLARIQGNRQYGSLAGVHRV